MSLKNDRFLSGRSDKNSTSSTVDYSTVAYGTLPKEKSKVGNFVTIVGAAFVMLVIAYNTLKDGHYDVATEPEVVINQSLNPGISPKNRYNNIFKVIYYDDRGEPIGMDWIYPNGEVLQLDE